MRIEINSGPMLNAYPDSMGGTLADIVAFLENPELKDVFSSFYILPSLFHTDLDRGFSVIDYTLNECLASKEDLHKLEMLGMDLKLDFILNHASVLSRQFQDMIKHGEQSPYKDFFINWNDFWKEHGTMTEEGYIQPNPEMLEKMFFRKPGLPFLMVGFPNGKNIPYWNTFYQEVNYPVLDAQDIMGVTDMQYAAASETATFINKGIKDGLALKEIFSVHESDLEKTAITDLLESRRKYLGQMDLNIKSEMVWEFYEETLRTLSGYGAKIVRLDAFAYAHKEPGSKNFLNQPGTWNLLEKVQKIADKYNLSLLPEIHATYGEKIYELLSEKGYITYDFFLPGLIIDALESGKGNYLAEWAEELHGKNIKTINMLGCHDGIPLLDLKGLLTEERIKQLIEIVVNRGGYVKNLHGSKDMYYQVNATYYSALGEDDRKLLLARAIQMFMPGKPQIWYLDLFAGKNDYDAVARAGTGGHKDINRTNLGINQIKMDMELPIVKEQLSLIKMRNNYPAFGFDAKLKVENKGTKIMFVWEKNGFTAKLDADLKTSTYQIVLK
ncbi:glycosidase [Lachnospiraceae bacterium OttesenSCG-928-D06]|nr:glycosidase [Lachnospiraceae bacterium OttesenSCG-928-D06]